MTTYYKGNNIGLNYDAAAGTWSFTNTPQDFIDPNAFSSPDPKFPTAPTTPTTLTEPKQDPCPAGYIYDNSLKQCVPDPNYQNPFAQQEQQNNTTEAEKQQAVKIAGTNRTTMNGNFIATDEEYNKMTPQELVENYKQRGMISKDENGNLVIDISPDMGDKLFDSQLARFGQGGETDAGQRKHLERLLNKGMINSKLNSELMRLYPMGATAENFPLTLLNKGNNAKIVIPTTQSNTVKGNTNTEFTPGFGQLTYAGFSPDIVAKFTNYINNGIAGGQGLTPATQSSANIKDAQEEEKLKKLKFETKISELREEAERKRQIQQDIANAEQQQQQEQEQQQSNERDRVRDEYEDKGTVTYNTKDTGGYVTTPNTGQNKPPSERSGYTGSSKETPRTGPNLRFR